ncbi:hypothetical protein [Lactiplantibacillus plantarum]|uniref:hypothetical protein n=1 Tax=Lactiplantibacillus plantarum TaxID=1590 RepID=UPI000977B080|nr:hypothetical protein [Lactiplantibacillus plantarum]
MKLVIDFFKTHLVVFYSLVFCLVPCAVLLLIFCLSKVPWKFIAGTNDGWLGFWGGYLGAIITILGVFMQIRSERKSEIEKSNQEKKRQKEKFEQEMQTEKIRFENERKVANEQIKLQQIATLQKESLVSLLVLMEDLQDAYDLLANHYTELESSVPCYQLDGKGCLPPSEQSNAKDFVFNMNYYATDNKVQYSHDSIEKLRLKTIKFKINHLQFFPFVSDKNYLGNSESLSRSLDEIIKNLKGDFLIDRYINLLSSYFSTYQNDGDLQNIVANVNSTARDGLSKKVSSFNFDLHKRYFDSVLKESLLISNEYAMNKKI